ncbi:hypothetical protein Psuf_019520 [Phytohabitans suffuscus]|uniref:Uncharacterized protein n=1 Tax=Phytohabitans suffuscus TaxID=624315 RepID=A0A6F8YF46_9ACTN|nr:hypothetical protein Psuf_019520 [Phytohabitans suffuscus]
MASVASEVLYPRTSSQSFIIGTGEKKWVPTTDSGRWVAAAIWVTGIALVFVASTAPGPQILSSCRKTSCLTSSRSNTASTTMSAPAAASRSLVVEIRPSVASTSSGWIAPLLANFSSDRRIPATPRLVAASSRSRSVTSQPACAATCAMPEPIRPAPMTASRPAMLSLLNSFAMGGC